MDASNYIDTVSFVILPTLQMMFCKKYSVSYWWTILMEFHIYYRFIMVVLHLLVSHVWITFKPHKNENYYLKLAKSSIGQKTTILKCRT